MIIVENQLAAGATGTLAVGKSPILQIGETEDPRYQFDGVVAGIRLHDGRYAIADRGSAQIRIFSSAGRIEGVLGRRGAGPGEFANLFHIWQDFGDSVRAWDGRLSTFSLRSPVARTVVPQDTRGEVAATLSMVRGVLSDGSFLVYQRRVIPVSGAQAVTRDTLVVWHSDREGRLKTLVGRFLAAEVLKGAEGTMVGPSGTEQPAFSMRAMPFARNTFLASVADALISTDSNGETEWHLRSLDGRLRRIARIRRQRIRVTPEVVRRQQAEMFTASRHWSLSSLPVAHNLPLSSYPAFVPAYSALRVDAEQRIWARHMAIERSEAERWDVFRLDGTLLGVLEMPDRFTPLEAGVDYVIGVWRDDVDVEFIRVYRLVAIR